MKASCLAGSGNLRSFSPQNVIPQTSPVKHFFHGFQKSPGRHEGVLRLTGFGQPGTRDRPLAGLRPGKCASGSRDPMISPPARAGFWLALFLLALAAVPARADGPAPDLPRYDVDVVLDPARRHVKVRERIS